MTQRLLKQVTSIGPAVPTSTPEKGRQGQGLRIKATSKAEQRKWTDEETALARQLLKEHAPESEYRRQLGRTKTCARARIERLDYLAAIGTRRAEPEMFVVPVEVWIERSRRIAAPRSLTASVMGDPPPGFSALDRKRQEAAR